MTESEYAQAVIGWWGAGKSCRGRGDMNGGDGDVLLALLGGFDCLCHGRTVQLPRGTQRLLAYLAVHDRCSHRCRAADSLWPDSPPTRAAANLRSALWRGRRVGSATLIECNGPRLRLLPTTRIDLTDLRECADRMVNGSTTNGFVGSLIAGLGRELLPGWDEDWLILEREQWDQERLHTLERLALQLLSANQFLPALQTALTAIAIEPIRETAHRTVIEIHAAEGNHASALRHYQHYTKILDRELGVTPSPHMAELAKRLDLC